MHEVDQDVVVMYTLVTIFLFKIYFSKIFNCFLFIMFMRVYVGYLLLRVYVGYLLLRVYIGYLL